MSGCKRCKFAKWDRSESGRLSPKGKGYCSWSKKIQIPISYKGGEPIDLSGGTIWRNDKYYQRNCPTFQPEKK